MIKNKEKKEKKMGLREKFEERKKELDEVIKKEKELPIN